MLKGDNNHFSFRLFKKINLSIISLLLSGKLYKGYLFINWDNEQITFFTLFWDILFFFSEFI